MNPHPDTAFPSDYYLQGLRDLNPDVVSGIYKEFRQAIMRQIQQAGGTHGDAAVFFRTAVTEAAFQALKEETFPSEVSFFQYLNALALAHFKDWEDEKNQPETPPESDSQAEETTESDLALKALLPTSGQMLDTRQRIFAHRKWEQLPAAQQQSLLALVQDADLSPDLRQFPDYESAANSTHGSALAAFKTAIGAAQETWDTPLPHYAQAAIGDTFLGKIRDLTHQAERRTDASTSTTENTMDSRIRNLLIIAGLLLFGYFIYTKYFGSKTAGDVYQNHFDPPASIWEDAERKNHATPVATDDSLPPLPERPSVCDDILQRADEPYKQKQYREAALILAEVLDQEDLMPCQSDACYYLGLIGLQIEEPRMTIQFFAKIDDIERYGEDLYWFQALAYVKMAAQNEISSELARRALERAKEDSTIPERRAKADEMLGQLAK